MNNVSGKGEKEDIGVEVWLKGGKGDRKRDSEQVLTCEHTVSGNRREKEKEKKERRKG